MNQKAKKGHSGDSLNAAIRAFRDQFETVLLATVDADGLPEASYAPYLADSDGDLYVFVSELARHTGNLLNTRRASLLFIADERDTANPFARQRLSYRCGVNAVDREGTHGAEVLQRLEQRFGNIIRTLAGLPDFHLLRLSPHQGSYVEGFGAAWRWDGPRPPTGSDPLAPARG